MFKSLLMSMLLTGICLNLTAKEINLLCVGNSFTRNATNYLPQIAKSFPDCDLNMAIVYKGGSNLEYHWNRVDKSEKDSNTVYFKYKGKSFNTFKDLLSAEKWDVIVLLQQYGSNMAVFGNTQCEPYATNLYNYVKRFSPNSEIMIHQTWAYRPAELRPRGPKGDPLQFDGYQGMYDTITACYAEMAKKFNLKILPSGAAMKLCQDRHPLVLDPNFDYKKLKKVYDSEFPESEMPKEQWSMHGGPIFRKQDDGKFLFFADFEHLGPRGEYLVSCLWFEMLFGKDARSITFKPDKIIDDEAKELRALAHETSITFVQPASRKGKE